MRAKKGLVPSVKFPGKHLCHGLHLISLPAVGVLLPIFGKVLRTDIL